MKFENLGYPNVFKYWDTWNYLFSIWDKWKIMVLGVPILKHFRVVILEKRSHLNNSFLNVDPQQRMDNNI